MSTKKSRFMYFALAALILILAVANVDSQSNYTKLEAQLGSQQVETAKIKTQLNDSSDKLDKVNSDNDKLNVKLKEGAEKVLQLQEENESLKAELQAKIERESRREPNLYVYGQCTWYVKERIPYIGGSWGNANQWLASAQAYGFQVGTEPKAGAIGVSNNGYYGHVVYVEGTTKGGLVEISDMNYAGVGVRTDRTVEAWEYTYIYT